MTFYTPHLDGPNDNMMDSCVSARSLQPSSLSSCSTPFSNCSGDAGSNEIISSKSCSNIADYFEKSTQPNEWLYDDEGITKCTSISETRSDIVPSLDLPSEENYHNTPRDYTFSYRKYCESTKNDLKLDMAYDTWLSAKKKIKSDEANRRKKIQEEKRQELEDRKRLSKEKYEQWLENKARLQKQQHFHLSTNDGITSQAAKHRKSTSFEAEKSLRLPISDDEAQARLDEWIRTKRLQEERRLIKQQQEEEMLRELKEQRRQAAATAWEKWMADAKKKPKPVPLNRGIFTLRGTISDIFVNPNEWQPILSTDEINGRQ